ncbi:hypothetical protein D0Z08_28550 [Nocardioides immobilis]|uniref:Uncharacterized protein n=1 Tax=Nocardioides immobilis TaxID=2049295 RepID=A0A417XTP3_9ACTN|nr:hypothetical protein [Nocardioides immobilis]RHW23665.1 hypothetical protein D0Z08_28550 [Nocardioides immobilis]
MTGADASEGIAVGDVDDMLWELYGDAANGYFGLRCLSIQLATVLSPLAALRFARPIAALQRRPTPAPAGDSDHRHSLHRGRDRQVEVPGRMATCAWETPHHCGRLDADQLTDAICR